MKAKLFFFISVISILGCAHQPLSQQYLIGKWQSNEEKTLASMNEIENLPQSARDLFENNFFGYLTIEYTKSSYKSVSKLDNFETGFQAYEIISISDNSIVISEQDTILGNIESKIYPDGNCYYVLVSKYQFREYFCRVNK